MQARYYDPKIGRFLSPDPVTFSPQNPQQFNRYWYANGNPYKYTDPTGRCVVCLFIPAAGGIRATQTKQRKEATSDAIEAVSSAVKTAAGHWLVSQLKTAGMLSEVHEDASESASDKITDGTKPATGVSGKKGEREGSGGQAGADKTFDGVNGSNERTYPNGTKAKDFADGGTIETHGSTKSKDYAKGTPTVKIRDGSGKVKTTVRFPKEKHE
jgi:hypothetical protein